MAPSVAPSIAPSEVAVHLDLDAIDAEHERLRRLVLAQRKQKEIEILRAEFRGEEVNNPIEIEGTTLPVRKRPASIGLYSGHPKHLKVAPRKKFTGASLGELQEYLNEWQLIFDLDPGLPDEVRIRQAATELAETAASTWLRESRETRPTTWEGFTNFLRNVVQDPANRMSTALSQLWRYRQKDGQSVRELQEELARLRQDVTRLTEEQRHAWELLLALKPEIRLSVMRELREIESEELVLRAAQRHEELLKWQDRRDKREASKTQSSSKPGAGRGFGNAPAKTKQVEGKPAAGGQQVSGTQGASPSGLQCHRCRRYGHIARNCPQPPSHSTGANSVSREKRKEKDQGAKK